MDFQRVLTINNKDEVLLRSECYTRPLAEVAAEVVHVVHLACEAHVRAVLLEAVEGVILTPWVESLAEDLQTPPVLVYTGWLRSLLFSQILGYSEVKNQAEADHLMLGLAYVEAIATKSPLEELADTSGPDEALLGALAVITTTVRMHASATEQLWSDAAAQLLGLSEDPSV